MTEMKVVRFYSPGGPEKLQYEVNSIPKNLEQGEVLVKVRAASVIWPELHWPIYQRKDGSYVNHIPCHDFSGTVVQLGPGSDDSEIKVGSEVYVFTSSFTEEGARKYEGALAEYAVADLSSVALKPSNLSLLEAASVPLSALTAWQALHDHGQLKKGQRLLVTGAAGATGFWAVQMAHMIGAHVIGTASSPRSFEILNELKIDEIIDYKKQNLEDAVSDVDLVLDTVGGNVLQQCTKVVKKDGMILSIVDYDINEKVKNVNAKFFIVSMEKEELQQITKLIETGTLRTFIDTVYPLERAVDAYKKGSEGHAHGKILVEVSS